MDLDFKTNEIKKNLKVFFSLTDSEAFYRGPNGIKNNNFLRPKRSPLTLLDPSCNL